MADEIKDGGPAFPVGSGDMRDPTGMTLRDYFAAQALPAVYRDLWDDVRAGKNCGIPEDWREGIAKESYMLADEMLKAREQ